jgi:hypothetical protein
VLATVFFGFRGGWIALAVTLAALAIVGGLVHMGVVSFAFDVEAYATSPTSWMTKVLTIGTFVGSMIFVLGGINRDLMEALTALGAGRRRSRKPINNSRWR